MQFVSTYIMVILQYHTIYSLSYYHHQIRSMNYYPLFGVRSGPYKFEKFNKHKHKNNKWISFGIIRSIKTRDMTKLKFKRCNQQSVEYNTLKNNLHVFNCILKKTIREAKIQYYDKLFTEYKGDIKKTWQTISVIICKSNIKRKTLDKIIVDSQVIKDKQEICIKFNDFFANIGPKLASQIKPSSNKT